MTAVALIELKGLLAEHHLLLFRRQKADMDQLVRVAKRFGPVVSDNGMSLGSVISNCRPDGALGKSEICFHSDLSYGPYPQDAVLMRAVDVVDGASSTRFASGARAYAKLTAEQRNRIVGLQALLVWGLDPTKRNRNADVPPYYPRSIKPIVWHHPATSQPCLYLDQNSTDSIVGLPPEESEALLQELWGILLAEDNIYEHRWNMDDTILWDNMALLHARGDMSNVGNRTLYRITIGKQGYLDMFPQMDIKSSTAKLEVVFDRERLLEAT
jgi:taurine dioxygenase